MIYVFYFVVGVYGVSIVGGLDPEGEGETDSCADHEQGLADDAQLISSVIHV